MAKSERVAASIEEVFADDPEFLADLNGTRDAAQEGAHFVKKLRASAGLTQRQLAARLGISQPRVSAMERGAGPEGPSYVMLKRVANACGIPWSLEAGLTRARVASKKPAEAEAGVSEQSLGHHIFKQRYEPSPDDLLRQPQAPVPERPLRPGIAQLVEKVLQAIAPHAAEPAEQVPAEQVPAEQVTGRKIRRYRASRGGSGSLRRD